MLQSREVGRVLRCGTLTEIIILTLKYGCENDAITNYVYCVCVAYKSTVGPMWK